jgi:hypothetical protein
MPRGRTAAIVAITVLVHVAAIAALRAPAGDLPSTYFYPRAHAVAEDGRTPYRDFVYEYPPATIPLLVAPLAAGGDAPVPYQRRTIWLWGLVDLAVVGVLAWASRHRERDLIVSLAVWSVCVLVLGRLALTRFDLSVGLALLGAVLVRERRPGASALLLGVAVAIKAAPLAALTALARGARPGRYVALSVAVPIAVQVLFFAITGDPGLGWLRYQSGRGAQIESLAALGGDTGRALGASVGWHFDHGSDNLTGTLPDTLARLFAVALVAWVVVCLVRRLRPTPEGVLVALGGIVVLSPILSPQYLLWLAPLCALAAPRLPVQAAVFALACVLTRLEVSFAYDHLRTFTGWAIALLAVRNLVLLVWLAVIWRATGTPTTTASWSPSRWPARSGTRPRTVRG